MPNVPSGAAISLDLIERIVGRKLTKAQRTNARSVIEVLDGYGARVGLDQPHREAQYLAQVLHESGAFRYDRELWGPTPAQKSYDTRTDLGNTAAKDGDGFLFRGHTAMQITGRANTMAFRDWCRKTFPELDVPDFVKNPDAMLTDPWEGLGPLWYWTTRGLNRFADSGDIEMITKRINGGLNGYRDRLDWYAATSLVMLGHACDDVRGFQKAAGLAIDGVVGPRTRAAMHKAVVALSGYKRSGDVMTAPVVEDRPKVPEIVDESVRQRTSFWGKLTAILGGGGLSLGWLVGMDWQAIVAIGGVLIAMLVVLLVLRRQLVGAVKDIRAAVEGAG